MTLEPRVNKYVSYFANIRLIQDQLCREATAAKVKTGRKIGRVRRAFCRS